MYKVLLSGGSGKRLWPLSNDLRSKQFIKVIEKENSKNEKCSMVQRVWAQMHEESLDKKSIITANKGQVESLQSQLGMSVNIAIEPERRDTFPAIVLSCAYLKSVLKATADDIVTILPVDPYTEQSYFKTIKTMESVLVSTNAQIVLMGALPTYPSSKYGYIMPKIINNDHIIVNNFVEKPSETDAEILITNGALWNCGVFCFRIGYILDKLNKYKLTDNYDDIYKNYELLPKTSFDYEILENCSNIAAVPFNGYWKDLGTWNTLTEEMNSKTQGNVILDKTTVNTHVINELNTPMVIMGAKDMIISASPDGILVADKHQSSYLKECISDLNYPPMYEERRWGSIEVMNISTYDKKSTTTRKISILSGMNSSYHFHNDRNEIWTILHGRGEMIVDGIKQNICEGSVIQIPSGVKHAVKAINNLEFIEVQIGQTIADEDMNRITVEWDSIKLKGNNK